MKEQAPEPDSEDSLTPERTLEVVQRLLEIQESRIEVGELVREDREVSPSQVNPEKGFLILRPQEDMCTVHTHRKGEEERDEDMTRPDPFMFNTTIFIEHEALENEMQDDPIGKSA